MGLCERSAGTTRHGSNGDGVRKVSATTVTTAVDGRHMDVPRLAVRDYHCHVTLIPWLWQT